MPYDPALWDVFRRTELKEAGSCTLDEIPDRAKRFLENSNSLLIVCNKKDEASYLFRAMRDGGVTLLLSTHDLQEIALCDALWLLRDGVLAPCDCGADFSRLTELLR